MPTPKRTEATPEVLEETPAAVDVTPPPYDPIENHPELLAELQRPTAPAPFRRFAGQQFVDGRDCTGKPVKIPV